MSVIKIVILVFSLLGLIDRIFGNKLGLGKEFERGFQLFGAMALSMIGMIILAPALGVWLTPAFEGLYQALKIDPSVVPALLFANDMGGASLATELAKNPSIGGYNAFVVSSMMGCVISFTIPFASGVVPENRHKELFFGFLCGIVTIPVGCFVAGFMCGLTLWQILLDLLPLLVIAIVIAVGILLAPNLCVKIFRWFGLFIKTVVCVGLGLGIFVFLTGKMPIEHLDTLENGAMICVNACVTLSGSFPLMYLVGKMLEKPTKKLSGKIGINTVSALGFIPTLITNATTFGMMKDMDEKGAVLNAAFSVSAAFVFGSHLGFTMGINSTFVAPMVVGKIISGIAAVALAAIVYKPKKEVEGTEE
jgi:ethanolamine transporter